MDGVPLSTSATNLTIQPRRPEPYSARYSPVPMPMGSPISAASPTTMPVDDRVGNPATSFARRNGVLGDEVPAEGRRPLGDQVAEDQHERQHRGERQRRHQA